MLRAFVRDGRLISIPTVHSKRLVVLDWLSQRFEPGRRYSEQMVNLMLAQVHSDTRPCVATSSTTILVASGEYWRTGGSYGPDAPAGADPAT